MDFHELFGHGLEKVLNVVAGLGTYADNAYSILFGPLVMLLFDIVLKPVVGFIGKDENLFSVTVLKSVFEPFGLEVV